MVHRFRRAAARQDSRKSPRFAATTEAPTGVDRTKEAVRPAQKQVTEVTVEQSTTLRKLLNSRRLPQERSWTPF